MEFRVHENIQTVEVWLTRAESRDAALRERMKPQYRQWKAQKYLVAVFSSGEGDLVGQTAGLLRKNLTEMAEKSDAGP